MSDESVDIEVDGNEVKVSQRLSAKQKLMLDSLKLTGCNVSAAAEQADIGRATHYVWIEKNSKYREAVEDLGERLLDLVESKLMVNINAGDHRAISYYLDAQGKTRGYGQTKRLELGGLDGQPISHADVTDDVLKEKLEELGLGGKPSQLDGKRVK